VEYTAVWQRRRLVLLYVLLQKYVQLTFLRGADLDPVPPGESKVEGVRYFKIYEDDAWDAEMIANWIAQATKLPGVKL
jgi:hypothetical protein